MNDNIYSPQFFFLAINGYDWFFDKFVGFTVKRKLVVKKEIGWGTPFQDQGDPNANLTRNLETNVIVYST